jgi:hypothetical protein
VYLERARAGVADAVRELEEWVSRELAGAGLDVDVRDPSLR